MHEVFTSRGRSRYQVGRVVNGCNTAIRYNIRIDNMLSSMENPRVHLSYALITISSNGASRLSECRS